MTPTDTPTHPTGGRTTMQPEYEAHNFDTNEVPRSYEAVYVIADKLLVKALVYQTNRSPKGAKPAYAWRAQAVAWTPGQSDGDYTQLCHLQRSEMLVRDIVPHEADEDTWLLAVRADAARLMERAQVFATVIAATGKDAKRRVAR